MMALLSSSPKEEEGDEEGEEEVGREEEGDGDAAAGTAAGGVWRGRGLNALLLLTYACAGWEGGKEDEDEEKEEGDGEGEGRTAAWRVHSGG